MLLIQQHNIKEEQILYPMMDQLLANATDLATQLQPE
jgi:iron-sulfur cluster repair protein YtfE (RIC family)